nr:MarR family winged helix-turn-helix transcriptional regulator [Curtobacterium sp. WW7]
MSVIASVPECRVSDVADALVITRGGASKLVDRLRADGWCTRTPHPTDGRSGFLELTPAGRRVLDDARTTFRRAVSERLGDRLDEHAAGELIALLRRLRTPGRPSRTDHD